MTQMIEQVMTLGTGSKLMIMAPFVRDQKGEHKHIFEEARKAGYSRVRVDGTVMDLNEAVTLNLDKKKKHSIDVVVDRVAVDPENRNRIADSLEKALDLGDETAIVVNVDSGKE